METRNYNRLSVSEILSRSFNILKDNILEILKVIGIFIVPATVVTVGVIFGILLTSFFRFALMSSYMDIEDVFAMMSFGSFFLVIIIGIISSLVIAYANAVITKIIDDANKGNQVSWRSANSYVWERKWKVVGLNVLVWLIFFFSIVLFVILGVLLSALTLGIGFIIFIPAIIAISVMIAPLWGAFNSMLIVNDINITDSIRETFSLFRKGYFWSTVGHFAAISGITIGIGILLSLFSAVPFLGIFIVGVGQILIQIYIIAYITIYVLDRTKPIDSYNNYSNFNSNYNYDGANNNYDGLNNNYIDLDNRKVDSNSNIEENNNSIQESNDENNKDDDSGFIDPIN